MVASSLAGLALSYYYDNPGNVKLMNILKVGACRHSGTAACYAVGSWAP